MATMEFSLPDKMKQWIEEQVAEGRYNDVSEYVGDLVRRDQERTAKKAEFARLVQEGRDSGVSPLTMDEILAEARRRANVKPDAA